MPKHLFVFSLAICASLLLTGCGSTRVAIPVPSNTVIRELPQSGIFASADRLHWEGGYDGRQRLIIAHRDPSAYIKEEVARTILVVTTLSKQTSELLIRSDHIGWLWNFRDDERERQLARDIRAWADQRAAPPADSPDPTDEPEEPPPTAEAETAPATE